MSMTKRERRRFRRSVIVTYNPIKPPQGLVEQTVIRARPGHRVRDEVNAALCGRASRIISVRRWGV